MITQVKMFRGDAHQTDWVTSVRRPRAHQTVFKDGLVWRIEEVYESKEEHEVHLSHKAGKALPSIAHFSC